VTVSYSCLDSAHRACNTELFRRLRPFELRSLHSGKTWRRGTFTTTTTTKVCCLANSEMTIRFSPFHRTITIRCHTNTMGRASCFRGQSTLMHLPLLPDNTKHPILCSIPHSFQAYFILLFPIHLPCKHLASTTKAFYGHPEEVKFHIPSHFTHTMYSVACPSTFVPILHASAGQRHGYAQQSSSGNRGS
jgi:hypothetical protein